MHILLYMHICMKRKNVSIVSTYWPHSIFVGTDHISQTCAYNLHHSIIISISFHCSSSLLNLNSGHFENPLSNHNRIMRAAKVIQSLNFAYFLVHLHFPMYPYRIPQDIKRKTRISRSPNIPAASAAPATR